MRSEVTFGALLAYSPRGQGDISKRSRKICYNLKVADPDTLSLATRRLNEHVARGEALASLFNANVTLIPMPRSAPLVRGALWPAERIAQAILEYGLAARIVPALERSIAVPKSAHAAPGTRPSILQHFESLVAHARVGVTEQIVIIDDVVTKGTTALAGVSRIAEIYPDTDIKLFAMIRTKGLVADIDRILDPAIGLIRLIGDDAYREP